MTHKILAIAVALLMSSGAYAADNAMPPQPKAVETKPWAPAADCPAVDLSALHNYDPFIQIRQRGPLHPLTAARAAQAKIVGSPGIDTLAILTGGDFTIDGERLASVEVYLIRNNAANGVHILAKGLATMKGRHALILGDDAQDTVYLDPCLNWSDAIDIDNGNLPLKRYDTFDKDGNKASVSVTAGIKVITQ